MINSIPQPPPPNRKPMAQVLGEGFQVYYYAKMGVIAYRVGKRFRDHGATMEEAAKAGAFAAIFWITMVIATPAQFMVAAWVIVTPIAQLFAYREPYAPPPNNPLLALEIMVGIMTLYVMFMLWSVLYSRLRNILGTPMGKRPKTPGRVQKFGFRKDRQRFLNLSVIQLGVMLLFSPTLFSILSVQQGV